MNIETKLILGLVERVGALLPYPTNNRPKMGELQHTASSLIKMGEHAFSDVIEGLLQLYAFLIRTSPETEKEEALAESKVIVFQLFSKAFSCAIKNKKLDLRFDDDFLTEDSLDLKSIPEPQDSDVELPNLDEQSAHSLMKYVCDTLFNEQPHYQQTLKRLGARILFKLSVVSFDSVFTRIDRGLRLMKNDDATDRTVFKMMEYMNFDRKRLSRLMSLLCEMASKFKKNAYGALSKPLRSAIWNWITTYPEEFVSLCQNKEQLEGKPEVLWGIMNSWVGSSRSKKAMLWPVMTMLLLLCPATLSTVVMAVKHGNKEANTGKESKFLESMLKALRGKERQLTEVSVACFVDVYKASTFVSKSDMSALRFLVPDVQNHLQEHLMKSDNPKASDLQNVDIKLVVEFLVSSFRLNQRHVTSYVFPICFSRPIVYQLCMCKALLRLAQEGKALPWHPTLEETYSFISEKLRSLFHDLLQEVLDVDSSRRRGRKEDTSQYANDTLLTLLAVFYEDPKLMLENMSNTPVEHINDMLYFFTGLCNCLMDVEIPKIKHQSQRLLQKLSAVEWMEMWCPQDMINGFVEISSTVLTQFSCMYEKTSDISSESTKTFLELKKDFIQNSNTFIMKHRDKFSPAHLNNRKRITAIGNTETALLVLLCSTETAVWSTAAACFGYLCEQIDILGNLEAVSNNTISVNYQLYSQLAAIEDLGRGRTAQQKKIRKLLRTVQHQTRANLSAFLIVYQKWQTLTDTMVKPPEEPETKAGRERSKTVVNSTKSEPEVDEKLKNTWRNYTTFLCALGGVCLQSGGVISDGNSEESIPLTDEMLRRMMKLITSDVLYVREMVTATIGSDLSPALFETLFSQLHETVNGFFGELGQLNITTESTLFVDQAVIIVKSIIEQTQEEDTLVLADFETLISLFVKYCSHLVLNRDSVRIKCKVCILVELVMNKREFINFKSEVQFRKDILKQITEWTSEFSLKSSTAASHGSGEQSPSGTASSQVALFKHLDVLCMRAIGALLQGLPLIDTTATNAEAKTKDFFHYLVFLSKYLKNVKVERSSQRGSSDTQPQLRDLTITALGNLLHANINLGLEFFMKMAYHDDEETRSAFLAVLTNIMKQGFNIEEEDERDPYEKLNSLLSEDDYAIPFALCSCISIAEQDTVTQALVQLATSNSEHISMLHEAITREVLSTSQEGTLFRANSTASKMMGAFARFVGQNYLSETLKVLVNEICENPGAFEINPSMVPEGQDREKNIENLKYLAQTFLDCIFASLNDVPKSFRHICNILSTVVEKNFPSRDDPLTLPTKHLAIGGFIFLRFLNPAIVTPQNFGLTEGLPNKDARRCLLLISKILISLANGAVIGKKETFMTDLQEFVQDNLGKAKEFFDALATIPHDTEENLHAVVENIDKNDCLFTLHRYLHKYSESLQQNLAASSKSEAEPGSGKLKLSPYDRLSSVLTQLGKPSDKTHKTSQGGQLNEEYTGIIFKNFMRNMSRKDTAPIERKEIFYASGQSKLGRPVVYFVPRNYDQSDDDDLLMYHVLKILETTGAFTNGYELVIDATEWTSEQEIKSPAYLKFGRLLPDGARKNLKRVICFNPNSYVKQFAKKFITNKKVVKKIAFCTGVSEIMEYIEEQELGLPDHTIQMEKQVTATFTPCQRVISNHSHKDCIVRLSPTMMFVITKDENILGKNCDRVDFIAISTISQVSLSPGRTEALDEVVVSYEFPPKYIHFRTQHKQQLIQAIKTSITRQKGAYQLAVMSEGKVEMNTIRISDIPGAVLNMCFLNLESDNRHTRLCAYNLLGALAEQFQFEITAKLVETESAAIPHNTSNFVKVLSQQLARSHKGMTLDFLKEALRGFKHVPTSQKYLVTQYIRPWLENLSEIYAEALEKQESDADEEGEKAEEQTTSKAEEKHTKKKEQETQDESHHKDEGSQAGASSSSEGGDGEEKEKDNPLDKIKEWIHTLVSHSIGFKDVYPALLNEVWAVLSRDKHLTELCMEVLLKYAVEKGIQSSDINVLTDLTVTLATHHASAVTKNLIDRTLFVLEKEMMSASEPLESHPPWQKVIIFCRFLLMLSFHNHIDVVSNLPYLLHIITLLVGRGSTYFRSTVHSICINVVHSLSTEIAFSNEQMNTLKHYMSQLESPKFRLIFLGSTVGSIDPFIKANTTEKRKLEETTMWKVEALASFFFDVMNTCFTADPSLMPWNDTWVDLAKTTAVNGNTILMPRVLAVYGVLARTHEAEDMLPFTLSVLTRSLENYNPKSRDVDLPVSVLLCVSQFVLKMTTAAELFDRLIVVPLMLLPASDTRIFTAVVHLLQCTLRALERSPNFHQCASIEHYFNRFVRDGKLEPIVERLEAITGISFNTNFPFAVASFLMKGLTYSDTLTATLSVLTTFANVSEKINTSTNESLGFISGMLPFYTKDGFQHIKDAVEGYHNPLFVEENFTRSENALLFVRFLRSVESSIDLENERVAIYTVLQHACHSLPQVFEPYYGHVVSRAITVYNEAQSTKIAEVTLGLINGMMAEGPVAPESKDELKNLEFDGIDSIGSFRSTPEGMRKDCMKLAIEFMSMLTEQAKEQSIPSKTAQSLNTDESSETK
eukprot:gb/GECH01013851.1/.p1 GENE.gb/GECH01013851.1/~~gb/GECH01013851.1/.p1  ORF type:complete len:2593 (+),score=587.89 gb/GECH01013851.1/:1-7779(+)